jgi:hypothetical protein
MKPYREFLSLLPRGSVDINCLKELEKVFMALGAGEEVLFFRVEDFKQLIPSSSLCNFSKASSPARSHKKKVSFKF